VLPPPGPTGTRSSGAVCPDWLKIRIGQSGL
jgi:hypothetical protein